MLPKYVQIVGVWLEAECLVDGNRLLSAPMAKKTDGASIYLFTFSVKMLKN